MRRPVRMNNERIFGVAIRTEEAVEWGGTLRDVYDRNAME